MHPDCGTLHSAGAPASGMQATAHPRPGLSRESHWCCRQQDTRPSCTATPEGTGRTSWPGAAGLSGTAPPGKGQSHPCPTSTGSKGPPRPTICRRTPGRWQSCYTSSAPPNKKQEPGWFNPPALVWSPDQEEHLRAAWQGDAIRATDVPDLHAGPITHARPAATLAVAQRGQQNPQWVVCMFSPADTHIVVSDPERLPGPEAVVRVADCTRMIVSALRKGEHHALLLQVRLTDNARAARPGVWPEAAHPADLELQLAVPTQCTTGYKPSTTCDGGANPTAKSAPRTRKRGCKQTRSAMPSRVSGPRLRHEPSMRRPRAARWRHTRFHWPTCPSNRRQRAPSGSQCRSPWRQGPRKQRNAPCVQTSTTQVGQSWNTWRGTRCTLQPRWTTRRGPSTSCKGGHGGPHGTPRTPGAPRPRRPTTQTAMRRHPERPR